MKQINSHDFNKVIKDGFSYDFTVDQQGLYVIEILASARSWWQNLKGLVSFFQDDNLAVTLNGISFPKR